MAGNTIIIILLFPIFFQIFWLGIRQTRRHREIQQRLSQIEEALRNSN